MADATGRPAHLARRLGARRLRYDRLVGAAALLRSPAPASDTYTLVEAVPAGWWYSALLADGRMAVAFMTDGDLLDRGFRGRVESRLAGGLGDPRDRASGWGTGRSEAPASRILPAETSRLDRISGEGLAGGGGRGGGVRSPLVPRHRLGDGLGLLRRPGHRGDPRRG